MKLRNKQKYPVLSNSNGEGNSTLKLRNWSEYEQHVLVTMFPDNYTETICNLLNRSYSSVAHRAYLFGLKKSADFKQKELEKQGERLYIAGKSYRYTAGNIPDNKGKKITIDVYKKLSPTMFVKGRVPHNAKKDWEEVYKKSKSGKPYLMVKVPGIANLQPKHIWLWETKNGKVEKGFNIVFKDGNQLNCTIENLEYISNAELMKRNTIHRFPDELKSTIKLVNKLKKAINEK
jgi:hypothetical protein